MGRRILWRPIWGYFVCLCPIKRTPGLYGLTSNQAFMSRVKVDPGGFRAHILLVTVDLEIFA